MTRENILSILQSANAAREMDVLSIDIDGNDYWLWGEIAKAYSPRVLVIEYNACYVPGIDWVMPYRPGHVWDTSNYFGASLDACERLGKELGYALVACDSRGVNAFFVREDCLDSHFPDARLGTAYH